MMITLQRSDITVTKGINKQMTDGRVILPEIQPYTFVTVIEMSSSKIYLDL